MLSQNYFATKEFSPYNGFIVHTDKIGIGNNFTVNHTPRTTLHLHNFNSSNTFINITTDASGFPLPTDTLGLWIGMYGQNSLIFQSQNAPLSLFTNKQERLTISGDGKIGIGTNTPTTALDVNGQLRIRGGNPGANKFLVSDANGIGRWMSLTAGNGIAINDSVIVNTSPDIPITITGSGATTVSGTYPNFVISSTDNNTIYTGGNGITISGTTIHSVWTKTNNNIYNNNSGFVGIGTSTPQNIIHIHSSGLIGVPAVSGIQITHSQTGSQSSDGLLIGYVVNSSVNNHNDNVFRIMSQEQGSLQFGTNNQVVMTIRGDRVGIGTLQPGAKLHVQGNVRLEGIEELSQATGARVLLIDNQGYVKRGQLSLVGDNLGNHTATQNIKLGSYWLSNDGSNYGIRVNSLGDVLISGRVASGHEKGLSENNGFEVVTRGRVPERRGISLDDDPSGNVNFWIHNWQNPAAFNFMRNDAGSTKKLMVINKNGQVGINVDNPQYTLHVSGSIRFEQLPQQQQINTESVLISDAQGVIKVSPASQLKDNLGNHTATQNIKLGNYWLSNDGSDKGLQIKSDGNIQVGNGITQVNIGGSYSNAPYYLSSYIGFNAQRNSQGQWTFQSDGANNGGAAMLSDVAGNLRIVTYRPTQGTTIATLSESDLMANTQLLITSNKKIGLRTTNINANADVQIKGTTYFEDKIGIGICLTANNNPKGYRLAVNGTMGAKDIFIEIDETPWPDYVFEEHYELMPLSELEAYITQNKHLPDIPTANEIKQNGLSLAEINAKLVKKIEELTLYIIELNKKIEKYEKNK